MLMSGEPNPPPQRTPSQTKGLIADLSLRGYVSSDQFTPVGWVI